MLRNSHKALEIMSGHHANKGVGALRLPPVEAELCGGAHSKRLEIRFDLRMQQS